MRGVPDARASVLDVRAIGGGVEVLARGGGVLDRWPFELGLGKLDPSPELPAAASFILSLSSNVIPAVLRGTGGSGGGSSREPTPLLPVPISIEPRG